MIVTVIGKVQNDRITVRTYDGEDLTSVGIHYAGTIRQGCEYLMPPDQARELARMLTEAADALEGSQSCRCNDMERNGKLEGKE